MNAFFGIWTKFDGLPERVLLNSGQAHGTERHYPLRPELIESAYHLYRATKDPKYKEMGRVMMNTIQNRTRVKYGYSVLRDVITGAKDDYMPSYFLAETLKYLLLLFDDKHWANRAEWDERTIMTTEGHYIPVVSSHVTRANPLEDAKKKGKPTEPTPSDGDPTTTRRQRKKRPPTCPNHRRQPANPFLPSEDTTPVGQGGPGGAGGSPMCQASQDPNAISWTIDDGRQVSIELGHGSFKVNFNGKGSEVLEIRNLGTSVAEILNFFSQVLTDT